MTSILSSDKQDLHAFAELHKDTYQKNNPFPNIYFDDFFDKDFLMNVLSEFPDLSKKTKEESMFYSNPNEQKHASKGDASFGEHTQKLTRFLNSETFLVFLQKLTGIKETLIPDPYFEGGGFHEIKPGGFLKMHVDFHMHRKMKLARRLNLLVYLNPEWEEEYGGHFELWEKDMSKSVVKITPHFNRIALFSTTGDSWHGHPDPLTCPPDRSRKSLALYYYTNGRPKSELKQSEAKRITTTFAEREGIDSADMKKYNTMVNVANRILPKPVISLIKRFRNT